MVVSAIEKREQEYSGLGMRWQSETPSEKLILVYGQTTLNVPDRVWKGNITATNWTRGSFPGGI